MNQRMIVRVTSVKDITRKLNTVVYITVITALLG